MIGIGEIVTAMARGRMLPMTPFTGGPPRSQPDGTPRSGEPALTGPSRLAAHAVLRLSECRLELFSAAAVDRGDRFAHRAGERGVDGAGFGAVVDGDDA